MINVYFVEKFSEGDKDMQLDAMRKYMRFTSLGEADVILCGSIVQMHKAIGARGATGKPLAVYCWDYYKWAHDGVRTGANAWEWTQYAEFLRSADLVMVPSMAQKLRLQELLGQESTVIWTGIKDLSKIYPDIEPTDGGFILDPLRYYPEENAKWAELAAEKLGIPIIHSEHRYTDREFAELIASCTFMTCAVREASTGSLTISEGLYFGKRSLISNSPYLGAKDYVGKYAVEFQYDDFDDLCAKMESMWKERKTVPRAEAQAYCDLAFSFDAMGKRIYESLHRLVA